MRLLVSRPDAEAPRFLLIDETRLRPYSPGHRRGLTACEFPYDNHGRMGYSVSLYRGDRCFGLRSASSQTL